MSNRLSSKKWMEEFQDFIAAPEEKPPGALSERIMAHVHSDLNPPFGLVFAKLSLIHAMVGTLTLLFCPQFGLSPLSKMGLMHVFMRFGQIGCMLGCGAFYIGVSALTASQVLKNEEIKVLRHSEVFQFPLLGLLSMGAFICMGATVVAQLTLFWFIGSIFGGVAAFELGWQIRKKLTA